jgi:DNA-directed RNA polymerase specialized sigma24 family protein
MDHLFDKTVDYRRVSEIAYATVNQYVSESFRMNLAEQVAADTVEQYLKAVEAGEKIHNPYAWVQIRARWRAIDAMRRWQRYKQRTIWFDIRQLGEPEAEGRAEATFDFAIQTAREHGDPSHVVEAQQAVRELIDAAFPEDSTNRRLAVACLVEGAKPREVADEFGMKPKVIGNRLVRIRAKLLDKLPIGGAR